MKTETNPTQKPIVNYLDKVEALIVLGKLQILAAKDGRKSDTRKYAAARACLWREKL